MEEKKVIKKKATSKEKDVKENTVKKLSYEELEDAARQIAMQFDQVRKENAALKSQVQQLQLSDVYTELGLRFKVLENPNRFDPNFVDYCVNSIQEIMMPKPRVEESNEE